MLFTEEELYSINPLDILDECMYLGYDESLIDPRTIPITENSRLGYNIVRFDDVYTLSESYGIDYIDAMYSIAEGSGIDPNDLAVSVPEEDIIAYPELVNELANIVIEPLSEDSLAYGYVTACLEAYNNTGNEDFLWAIVEDSCIDEYVYMLLEGPGVADAVFSGQIADDDAGVQIQSSPPAVAAGKKDENKPGWFGQKWGKVKNAYGSLWGDIKSGAAAGKITKDGQEVDKSYLDRAKGVGSALWKHKGATAGAVAGTAAVAGGLAAAYRMVQAARNKPKSWIGQKIAALRNVYMKWMKQAQNSKNAGVFKSAAAKILGIIDQLMVMMQKAAG